MMPGKPKAHKSNAWNHLTSIKKISISSELIESKFSFISSPYSIGLMFLSSKYSEQALLYVSSRDEFELEFSGSSKPEL